MVDTDYKSIRSRTAFDRLIDRESNHIFFKEMSRYAHMEYGSTSLQGKLINLVVYKGSKSPELEFDLNHHQNIAISHTAHFCVPRKARF